MNLTDLQQLLDCHPSPDGKSWLHGSKVAEWIGENHSDLSAQLGCDLRRIQEWRKGTPARLDSVDRVLTRLGGHIHELPPDIWIETPRRRPRSSKKRTVEPAGVLAA